MAQPQHGCGSDLTGVPGSCLCRGCVYNCSFCSARYLCHNCSATLPLQVSLLFQPWLSCPPSGNLAPGFWSPPDLDKESPHCSPPSFPLNT